MAAPTDHELGFEPRTRADGRRRLQLGALSAALWLFGLAATVLVLVRRDVIVTALLFTAACLVLSTVGLLLALAARRRREANPPPLPRQHETIDTATES